ncbi:DUF3987 domain-containing protein [Moraxella marmotae]|uniref:DUF3987 domain-containing protein n=1 Tax=Moraxella marmotae TaxID=3344520 RepID=UPI0035F27A2D
MIHSDLQLLEVIQRLFANLVNQGFSNITAHRYTDEKGNTLYVKARLKKQDGKKQIRPFYYNQTSKQWEAKEPSFLPNQKPLYNLHALPTAQSVWIFEGEQKADLMNALGYTATTTGGSNSITAHDLAPLAGKQCILWRDNDPAGEAWLNTFLHALQALTPTPVLLVVDVAKLGLATKGDIVDYMQGCDQSAMLSKLQTLPMLDADSLHELLQANTSQAAAVQSQTKTATPAPSEQATPQHEWGKPLSLDVRYSDELNYPIDCLGDELAGVAKQIAYYAQVPLAVAGQSVLGVISALGQRSINAPFLNSHIPASLFLITEFPSGQGKSYATRLSQKALSDWDKARYKEYATALKSWEQLPPKERVNTPKPRNQTFVFDDATIEGVTDKFIIDEQKNLYWNSAEAAQFFNGYSMKSDTASNGLSSIIKLWDGSPISKTRSQRSKAAQDRTHAYDARLTLDLMGQREILEPAMTDPILVNQGFLPRALLACPQSFQGYREYNTPARLTDDPNNCWELNKFWAKCTKLLSDQPSERRNMPYSDNDAKQALADYMQQVEKRQRKGGMYAHIPAFAGRMGENTARIASLLAFFHDEKAVSKQHIINASQIVNHSINERLRYNHIAHSGQSNAQILIDWLIVRAKRNQAAIFGYSEIRSSSPKAVRQTADFELALDFLIEKQQVRILYQDDSKFIEINPYLLTA